jgi:glycerophosphoryl diester phosphodiesterase
MERHQDVLILGHRGVPCFAPENTIESFRRALEIGADGFEFDVRRSADGRLVVLHDPGVSGLAVSRFSYEQLRATRRGARLAVLEEVLREFGHAWLDMELKVPGIEGEVLELAGRYCRPSRYVITSFSRPVVARLRQLDRSAPVGWLLRRPVRSALWADLELSYLVPHHTALRPPLVEAARRQNLPLIAWTTNSPRVIRRALESGVAAIVSDFPDLARSFIEKCQPVNLTRCDSVREADAIE